MALLLVMVRTRRRRGGRVAKARPVPMRTALIVYAGGVLGLVAITYGPQSGLAGNAVARDAVTFLFMLATSILVMAMLSRRRT
ncbi:MAG: hypothetical protein WBF53_12880, partial [Litorimonas sp.]